MRQIRWHDDEESIGSGGPVEAEPAARRLRHVAELAD